MSDIRGPRSRYHLKTEGAGMAQSIALQGTAHRIEVDAVPAFGGQDAAPGPLAYALASLTSCSQATAQIVAQGLGLRLGRIAFELEAEIDMSVLVGLAPRGLPDFQPIRLQVRVETDAGEAEFATLREQTERRCPVFQLFSRGGVPIQAQWSRWA